AGSLVAYLTEITNIDPLRYNLLFERFLNPERVSPPDFDIDFCEKRRVEVIEYVRKKYGEDSVAQICTYGALKTKAVMKDVARVLGHDFDFGNRLSKLVPEDPKMTLKKAVEGSAELRDLVENDPHVEEVYKYAEVLEGLNRQLGIHAAGVIIGDQRLDNLVPLATGAGGEIITQYTAVPCEELGLLKMDFLGLRTLTIIKNALTLIEENRGVKINIDNIPLTDPKTFELLQRGDTVAVFQLESGGMQNLCRQFGVETLEHIIALLAIYRPGPMQFIPEFVRRKKGEEPIIYDHPLMEQYLTETYGIMLYQEQIMQVVQVLAGFSLGGADILRRAIGKKKVDVLAQQKAKFVEGCAKTNNIAEALASTIWDKIEMFAGYGFNKSHSAAYAMVSYQTAYLKANYPVEFMAAVLTSEITNAEEISFLISACREMGIRILPPDVNSSLIAFGVDGDTIRFGLGAIKGVGEGAAGKIIESRRSDGKFKDFRNFCERCGSAMNSRMMEHLTRAGAFDSLGLRRSQILAIAEPMLKFSASRAADLARGQASLFDMLDAGEVEESCTVPIPDIPEFSAQEILDNEKELLGFYVTGHPLDAYSELVRAYSSLPLREIGGAADNSSVRLAGMVGAYTQKFAKASGKPMGVLMLEDLNSTVECMLYERTLTAMNASGLTPKPGMPLLIEATVSKKDDSERPRIIVEKIMNLLEAPTFYTEELHIHLLETELDRAKLEAVSALCRRNPGTVKTVLCVVDKDDTVIFVELRRGGSVVVTPELLAGLDELLGPHHYRLKAKPHQSERPQNKWRSKPKETDKA
ncbi:MAG: DNA polymerase III subunit alpha, partial [Victivallaceae bacterium]